MLIKQKQYYFPCDSHSFEYDLLNKLEFKKTDYNFRLSILLFIINENKITLYNLALNLDH